MSHFIRRFPVPAKRSHAPIAPTTYTLYPSAQSGYLDSISNVDWASAWDGIDSVFAGAGLRYIVGQEDSSDSYSITLSCYLSYLDFDTSAVVGSVSSAALSLGLYNDGSVSDFTAEARSFDWGSTLTTGDWRTRSQLAALTRLATLDSSGIGSTGAYKSFTEDGINLRNAINQSGVTRMVLCGSKQVTSEVSSGSLRFEAYDHATLKPKLVISTAGGGPSFMTPFNRKPLLQAVQRSAVR